jgi:phage-related protein
MLSGAASDAGMAAGPEVAAAMEAVKEGLKGLTVGLAAATAAMYASAELVKMINPSAALLFQQALKDLSATIGSGLVPVITIFTDLINRVSGTLLPIMQQLAPLFAQLSDIIAQGILAAFQALAPIFQAFIPIIRLLLDAYEQYAQIIRIVMRVYFALIQALISIITSLFGANMSDVQNQIKSLGDAIKNLVVHLVLAAAAILNWIGAGNIVKEWQKKIQEMLGAQPGRGARAVDAINPQMSSIAQIGSQIALAAAGAMAGGPGMKEDESLKALQEIAKGMDDIVSGKESLGDTVKAALESFITAEKTAAVFEKFAFNVGKKVVIAIAEAGFKMSPIGMAKDLIGKALR